MIRFHVRPLGWGLIAITLLVQLAALNTGANLLYLVASGCLSFLFISLVLAYRATSKISIERLAPETVHRGEAFGVTLRIENQKRHMPASSLHIAGTTKAEGSRAYVQAIPPNSPGIIRMTESLSKRGVHRLPPIVVSSSFPFGMVICSRVFKIQTEVVVYPNVRAVRASALEQIQGSGQTPRIRRGAGDEYFSLRDYVPGDDPRRIVWKASARLGTLMVRELEMNTSRNVLILFDTRIETYIEDHEEAFEEAVELVASLAVSFLNRQYVVAVITPRRSIVLGEGSPHAQKIMDMLARAEPVITNDTSLDWCAASEDMGHAACVFIGTDPTRWGQASGFRGAAILNPKEVVRA